MNKEELISIAKRIAMDKEEFFHWKRVADLIQNHSFYEKDEKDKLFPVALFHDVVEERYFDLDKLVELIFLSQEQKEALFAITRKPEEKYFDYIERLKTNEMAIKVKLADLYDNIMRCVVDKTGKFGLLKRYRKAVSILLEYVFKNKKEIYERKNFV